MEVILEKGPLDAVKDRILAIALLEGKKPPEEIAGLLGGMSNRQFSGKAGESYDVTAYGSASFGRLLLIGLGKENEFTPDCLRKAAGTMVRFCVSRKLESGTFALPRVKGLDAAEGVRCLTEGAILANFRYDLFKSKKEDTFRMERMAVLGGCSKAEQEAMQRGFILANAQNYVRYMQELPANVFTPRRAAEEARKLAKEKGLSVRIYGKDDLEKKKMNGILSVNQGSDKEPVLVRLEYNPGDGKLPLFALVGKGVCFDSGGISIKPGKGMGEMKYDKTGALSVFGIMRAAADIGLRARLIALVPFVENMPSGSAQHPGDIITMYNGKTVEVLNTDAEGRMILADALAFAAEQKPEAIIDLATLTGAMVVALGRAGSGYFSNDDKLAGVLDAASGKSGEKAWRLPLWPEYSELMKGTLADIKNISGTGEGGSATAAAFLKEFVGESRWAHIDIAGTDLAGVSSPHPYLEKGAAGPCVRLVTLALEELAKK